jgi:SAM-dependent methyltransferase
MTSWTRRDGECGNMGFYSRLIFPRLCDWMLSDRRFAALRTEALAQAQGEVLEIGSGTGLNFAHYPERVRSITTVDPNPAMGELARKKIIASGVRVDARVHGGEALPFDEGSFDCVVSTWTLCSIPDAGRAVGEIHRVLKPGGRFIFLEHGLSDDPKVQVWQRRLNPIQRRLANGCRLDLDVEGLLRARPFADVQLERFLMEKTPRTHGTMYRGTALK